jgi:hypothetical protein
VAPSPFCAPRQPKELRSQREGLAGIPSVGRKVIGRRGRKRIDEPDGKPRGKSEIVELLIAPCRPPRVPPHRFFAFITMGFGTSTTTTLRRTVLIATTAFLPYHAYRA